MTHKPHFMSDAPVAIAFLEGNEGDEEERGACLAVAKFLREEWHRRDRRGNLLIAKRYNIDARDVARVIAKDRAEKGLVVP